METTFFDRLVEVLKFEPLEPLLFNSGFFLFFFLFVLLFHRAFLRNHRAKIIFLLVASLYFYFKSSGVYFILIVVSSLIDYFAGKWIFVTEDKLKRKLLLVISIITNLGLLGYFKYTNFFIQIVNDFSSSHLDMLDIFLPVGISFFTFQSMSYTIDIYREKIKPEEKFSDFLFFVSFFPQLVAGPIVRASDFLPQIHEESYITKQDIGKAVVLIMAGLFKKAVIADYISINFIDRIYEWPSRYTGVENLLAVYGYSLQIYCDFSGYSDMAIGLALLMGFKLPDNFNSPYKASTITEFWRRWHISLSSWLRDYLYIGLGGNRKGKLRTYFNLFATFLLCGLWHGAAWKFIIFGAIHGAVLSIEKFFKLPEKMNSNWLLRIVGIVITFHVFAFSLLFFRPQSFQNAYDMVHQIFTYFKGEVFLQFVNGYPMIALLIVIGYMLHYIPQKWEMAWQGFVTKLPLVGKAILLVIVIWLVAQFKSADIQPFIYFQF
jgi:alginate O-acetyltransferase complex protein AlgI